MGEQSQMFTIFLVDKVLMKNYILIIKPERLRKTLYLVKPH